MLIAGNEHVRRDRGVPRYLQAAGVAPDQIRSAGLLEEGDDSASPGAFDLVVRTAAQEREDPCAGLKRERGMS